MKIKARDTQKTFWIGVIYCLNSIGVGLIPDDPRNFSIMLGSYRLKYDVNYPVCVKHTLKNVKII